MSLSLVRRRAYESGKRAPFRVWHFATHPARLNGRTRFAVLDSACPLTEAAKRIADHRTAFKNLLFLNG